jgi:hypothetical protein
MLTPDGRSDTCAIHENLKALSVFIYEILVPLVFAAVVPSLCRIVNVPPKVSLKPKLDYLKNL